MISSKRNIRIQRMCVAALLCSIAILIPILSPVKIQIPPMSFTLGSHIAIFVSMFISPVVALSVELGSTLGFFLAGFPLIVVLRALSQVFFVLIGACSLAKKPSFMRSAKGIFFFGLATGIIHGIGEAIVVAIFWFSGSAREGTFLSTIIGLVGVGTLIHSLVDYYIALLIWHPVSCAAKLPANFSFAKEEKKQE